MMNLPIAKHEDERRILIEWNSKFPMKRCKVIETKDFCILGQHYHNLSDSIFYLFKGKAKYNLYNLATKKMDCGWLEKERSLFVPKGVVHRFEINKNSILLEAASEVYNKEDEIQVTD